MNRDEILARSKKEKLLNDERERYILLIDKFQRNHEGFR